MANSEAMKPRSIKVSEEQWKRWGADAAQVGVDRSTYIRQAVDSYSAGDQASTPEDLREAQGLIDSLTAEVAHLNRELAMRGQTTTKSSLPGMGRRRYACGECGNLNAQGRCMRHPNAKQKLLEDSV